MKFDESLSSHGQSLQVCMPTHAIRFRYAKMVEEREKLMIPYFLFVRLSNSPNRMISVLVHIWNFSEMRTDVDR